MTSGSNTLTTTKNNTQTKRFFKRNASKKGKMHKRCWCPIEDVRFSPCESPSSKTMFSIRPLPGTMNKGYTLGFYPGNNDSALEEHHQN
jgi:hypothetical protein